MQKAVCKYGNAPVPDSVWMATQGNSTLSHDHLEHFKTVLAGHAGAHACVCGHRWALAGIGWSWGGQGWSWVVMERGRGVQAP